jgi:hypothetical protein
MLLIDFNLTNRENSKRMSGTKSLSDVADLYADIDRLAQKKRPRKNSKKALNHLAKIFIDNCASAGNKSTT